MFSFKNNVTRLSRYKNGLKRLKSIGVVKVFSDNLADAAGVTPSQVRKDFSIFGISGNKKGGYNIDYLLEKIEKILCVDRFHKIILVGKGNIGNALIKYKGFASENIKIIAAFDVNEEKFGMENDLPVLSINKMEEFVKQHVVTIAIMAVPDLSAQETLNKLVNAGIKGILNFSPIALRAPENVYINNVDLEMELETVIFYSQSGRLD